MSLAPGTRIGVYEIRDSLGAGGMGEVYRARDTRLNRDVAIEPGPDFNFKPPVSLFEFRYPRPSQPPSYDLSADGSFLVIKPGMAAPATITVISNWAQNAGKTK